jgi:hypothetical protein
MAMSAKSPPDERFVIFPVPGDHQADLARLTSELSHLNVTIVPRHDGAMITGTENDILMAKMALPPGFSLFP